VEIISKKKPPTKAVVK